MIRAFGILAGALLTVGGCASYLMSPAESSKAGVACLNNSLEVPNQRVSVSFEDTSLCRHMADAYGAKLLGKPLDAKNADWADAVEWMNAQLDQGDQVIIDRFGRATLMRCSADVNLASPTIQSEPEIGDGKRQLYLMVTTPCDKPKV